MQSRELVDVHAYIHAMKAPKMRELLGMDAIDTSRYSE
jgi:hypothetical protein